MGRPTRRALFAATLMLWPALLAPSPSHAQSGPTWVALDTQPAGTPASVVFNADASSPSLSVLDVSISGFWVTQKTGTDGRLYQSIEVPGLPNKGQHGAPDLPVCRFDLGLVNGASQAVMQPPIVFASAALPSYLVWPAPIAIMLHEGTDEVFQRDEALYSSAGPWPTSDGPSPVPMHELLGFLPAASCEAYPFHWDPATGLLQIATHVRYRFQHSGPGMALPLTTPTQRKVVSGLLANWQTAGPSVIANTQTYSGYYLIVCPQMYQETLQPLADQKASRGLKVSWRFTQDIGAPTCSSIRNAIGAWYNSTPKGGEHYCLLVSDVDSIAVCPGPQSDEYPFGVPSDDPYGTPFAMNDDRQIMVGRLSPIGPSELDWTVKMILAYEDNPVMDDHYEHVLLVAHGGKAGHYDIWPFQEKVRLASYASPPNFDIYYGNVQGADNNGLRSSIEQDHFGLIDYIGHGSLTEWWCWDLTCQSFNGQWVGSMSLAPYNPIVWSIACETAGIYYEDCLGEIWMHRYGQGALAYYGSTVPAHAIPSFDMNQNLFYAVYSQDIRVQGYTYYDAEYRMENAEHAGDSWKYLLLGDPEMTIRTGVPPSPWVIGAPWVERSACGTSGCQEIRMHLSLASGGPAVGVRVSVWQPPPPGSAARAGSARVATLGLNDNRYTDASGLAAIPAPTLADGWLHYGLVDDAGNALMDSVRIQGGEVTAVPIPRVAAGPPSLRALPSVARAGTEFALGRPAGDGARLDLYDASGRRVRSFAVVRGAAGVRWDANDASGAAVAPGVYLASFRDADGQARARVVVLR